MNFARSKGSGAKNCSRSCKLQMSLRVSPLNMYVPVKTQISNWLLAAQAVHQKDFKKLHVAWWVSWDEPLEPPTQVSKRDFNSKSFYFSPCQIATDPAVRSVLRFFRGHERAPDGSALATTTARTSLFCDKQATEAARQKPVHFFALFSQGLCG